MYKLITFQRNSSKEEDDEHHIRKNGCDIDNFAGLGDSLNHAEINQ